MGLDRGFTISLNESWPAGNQLTCVGRVGVGGGYVSMLWGQTICVLSVGQNKLIWAVVNICNVFDYVFRWPLTYYTI